MAVLYMSQLCFGCMKENNGEKICPYCGFDKDTEQSLPHLPLGTKLQNENYIVGKKISSSAEGVKYIGYSNTMHSPVIINEFMPAGIAGRVKGKNNIIVRSDYEKRYDELHQEFLKYYRNIARFRDVKAITPIFDIFSENNTSYTVEESYESISFEEYLKWKKEENRHQYIRRYSEDVQVLSLDHPLPDGRYIDNSISSNDESVEDMVFQRLQQEYISKAVQQLSEADRHIIQVMFYGDAPLSEEDAAKALGLSKSALHRWKKNIFRKIEKIMRTKF